LQPIFESLVDMRGGLRYEARDDKNLAGLDGELRNQPARAGYNEGRDAATCVRLCHLLQLLNSTLYL
jgi:hypothetical protein